MNRTQLLVLAVAMIATVAMLLYPPYMVGLTGSPLGYHFAPQLPATVAAFGTVDAGRLLLQTGATWIVAAALLLALRTRGS